MPQTYLRNLEQLAIQRRPGKKAEDLRHSLRNTIETTLGYAPAGSFTELSLALPLTHDFATLIDGNQCMTLTRPTQFQDLLATLSHLDITIGDNSGLGGQRRRKFSIGHWVVALFYW